jgi:hypothetical protein
MVLNIQAQHFISTLKFNQNLNPTEKTFFKLYIFRSKWKSELGIVNCALNHQSMEKYLTSVIANGKAEF